MKITSINVAQSKVQGQLNQRHKNSKNIAFSGGYYSTPRPQVSGWTMAGMLLGGAALAILTGGASIPAQAAAMLGGAAGGGIAGSSINKKINGKKK